MAIPWDIWLFFAFLALSSVAFVAEGVIRFRTVYGASWKAAGFCTIAMVLCVGGTLGMYFSYATTAKSLEFLKKPPEPSHLEPHWGKNMTREDRTKYSQMLARISFENWGITVNYFDETGALRPYQATDADRARLQWRRQAVAHYEKTTNLLAWTTFGWLFIPWLGLVAAFVPGIARVLGALTGRSKTDAPKSGGAPLS